MAGKKKESIGEYTTSHDIIKVEAVIFEVSNVESR